MSDNAASSELNAIDQLASFDEALRRGADAKAVGDADVGRVQQCIRLLEEVWPRHLNNAPTLLQPALAAAQLTIELAAGPTPTHVGRFQIRRELGRGGFGIVYLAHDVRLRRDVALKVPRADVVHSVELRERFQQEARAAGNLDHPHIVPIYESGEEGPLCWIVSAYCPGVSLADWLRRQTESVPHADAARLVMAIAEGVEHAHERGILHRDLKPANVLLQVKAGTAGADGSALPSRLSDVVPKITDFGLAKLADADLQTKTGTTMGTPAYMAPEQAGKERAAAGAASDVYSLGVILYELVTGRPPFTGDSPLEVLLQARTDEPIPPSRLRHRVPRDLETICLKCLEKEPGRRYLSAGALASDLRRFLDGDPINARPVGALGRAARWARRRPAIAGLLVLLLASLTTGIAGIAWQGWRAQQNALQARIDRDSARQAQKKEAEALDRHRIIRAYDEWLADNAQAARDLLHDASTRSETWEHRYVSRLLNLSSHVFDDNASTIVAAEFQPDGRRLITITRAGVLTIRDLVDRDTQRVTLDLEPTEEITAFVLNPADQRQLIAAASSGFIHVIDLPSLRTVAKWQAQDRGSLRIAGCTDGRLAVSSGAGVRVWNLAARKEVYRVTAPAPVLQLAWSGDARYLAASSHTGEVRVWNAESGTIAQRIRTIWWQASCVAFSPDNRRFAWSGLDGIVTVHDTARFDRVVTLAGLPGYHVCMAFSPDSRFVAASNLNGPVKIWNVDTGQLVMTLHGHSSGIHDVVFSPDGTQLATVGADRRLVVWDIMDQQEVTTLTPIAPGRFFGAAFSPDSRLIATAIRQVRVWNLDERQTVFTSPNDGHFIASVAVHPNGRQLAASDFSGRVRVFDTSGKELASRSMAGTPFAASYADEGNRLLVAGWDNAIYAWSGQSTDAPVRIAGPLGREERAGILPHECAAAFSSDGRWLAYAERGQAAAVWDLRSRTRAATLENSPRYVTALAFDPTGRLVALGSSTGEIQLRIVATGNLVRTFPGHPHLIFGLAFSPEGTRLASTARDGVVKLWEVESGIEVLSLRGQATFDSGVAFSPDGQHLIAGGWDGYLRVWSIRDTRDEPAATRLVRRRAWHSRQAADATAAKNFPAALHHCNHLLQIEPGLPQHLVERGRVHAEMGDWPAALADLRAGVEQAEGLSALAYSDCALLHLRKGDVTAYQQVCRKMADRLGNTNDPATINRLVWTIAWHPTNEQTTARFLPIAEQALPRTADGDRAAILNTIGAALYRVGRLDEAIRRLNQSMARRAGGGCVEDWLFLAMAHHKKGNAKLAKENLERAVADVAKVRAGLPLSDGRASSFRLRTELDLLLRETMETLGVKSADK